MTNPSPMLDTLDIVFLGTIGLGTVAWFARKQLFSRFSGASDSKSAASTATKTAPPIKRKERNFVKVMQDQGRRVIFFYGSQTGTAEDYAARMAKECSQNYGISAMTADIEDYDLTYLDTMPEDCLAFFVLATYGEGEPTDNAVEFWDHLTGDDVVFSEGNEEEKPLKNLRYVVFGLGNKTYEHYNAVARQIDQKLTALGATRIGERGEGDDDGSLEEDFLAWQENMWPAFCEALGVDESNVDKERTAVFSVEELETVDEESVYHGELGEKSQRHYDAKKPFPAKVTMHDLFSNSDRHCLHVDIDISESPFKYLTGDHVAIWPTNSEVEVQRLAGVLGMAEKLDTIVMVKAVDDTASKKYPFPVPSSYRSIFRHYLDINVAPTRPLLASIAQFAPSEQGKAFLERLSKDKEEYKQVVADACRNLAEVLQLADGQAGAFSSIPFDYIVEGISRLQPRYYSISSSAMESPSVISATAVTLAYNPTSTPDRTVWGVGTNYLWALHQATYKDSDKGVYHPEYYVKGPRDAYFTDNVPRVPIHVRKSNFKLPRNPSVPVIMVGPGTGVAPFRGFVHERAFQKGHGKPVGTTLLFYGCRRSDEDFLYRDEWPGLFETLGGESRIITAFSREGAEKVYVQHRLRENAQQVWDLIDKQGAYIYVCGDAKHMAKDVQSSFIEFAQTYGGKDADQAEQYVKSLRSKGRYQEDVWS
ncbi:hypothetical protein BC943DRAFT_358554 [Umbelopsis sp. AD052]|nr:hypothetical protein BC943DRAFT_358554 [Umbelopsis sp. AD052]